MALASGFAGGERWAAWVGSMRETGGRGRAASVGRAARERAVGNTGRERESRRGWGLGSVREREREEREGVQREMGHVGVKVALRAR